MMTTRAFCQWSLLLPLVLPISMLPVALYGTDHEVLQVLALVLLGSLLWGGVPYAGFAVVLALKMRGSSPRRLRELAWWCPVRFAGIQGAFTVLYMLVVPLLDQGEPRAPAWAIAAWSAALALFAAVLGWAYVVLAAALHFLGRRLGILREGHDPVPPTRG